MLNMNCVGNCCKAYAISGFYYRTKKEVDDELAKLVQKHRRYAFLVVIFNHQQYLKYKDIVKKHGFELLRKSRGNEGYDKKPLYLYVRMQPKEPTNA